MPRKRKAFIPSQWMEPTSDNDWEESAIPSSVQFKKKTLTFKLPSACSTNSVSGDSQDISSQDDEVLQNTPLLPSFNPSDEPVVDISSQDEYDMNPPPPTLSNPTCEPLVEISSQDELFFLDEEEQSFFDEEEESFVNEQVSEQEEFDYLLGQEQEHEEEEEDEEEEDDDMAEVI